PTGEGENRSQGKTVPHVPEERPSIYREERGRSQERRGATASQTASATSSLGPRGTSIGSPPATRMVAALSGVPKARFSPTWLTTSRSQPLRASLAWPLASTSWVSAANPTSTAGEIGRGHV